MLDRILWLLLAAGHATPVLPAFQPDMLARLYGVALGGDVAVLMRHRGILFLAVAVVAIWSAFDPRVRMLGIAVLTTSIAGFLLLYLISDRVPGCARSPSWTRRWCRCSRRLRIVPCNTDSWEPEPCKARSSSPRSSLSCGRS